MKKTLSPEFNPVKGARVVLVAGSTGALGSEICRLLRQEGHEVKGLVRTNSNAKALAELQRADVELVQGDLSVPDSLESACHGVEAVISTATAMGPNAPPDGIEKVDRAGQSALVDVARRKGVRHFVYVSYTGNIDFDDPLTRAKRTVERRLARSGIPRYTILRPSYFMESWLSPALGFDYETGEVTFYGSGERAITWIALSDVARFAVECIRQAKGSNATLELGGPESLSPLEVVHIFESVMGRRVTVTHVPESQLAMQMEEAATPVQEAFAALMWAYANGDVIASDQIARDFGIERIKVRDYAARVAGTAGPDGTAVA